MKDTRYWRRLMEGANEEVDPEMEEEHISKTESDEIQIVEEIVYPFRLTEKMLVDYEDPAYNRSHLGDVYQEVLVKLLRSAKFWRISIPRWLLDRLKSFGVI
jgi:hypothetical protein